MALPGNSWRDCISVGSSRTTGEPYNSLRILPLSPNSAVSCPYFDPGGKAGLPGSLEALDNRRRRRRNHIIPIMISTPQTPPTTPPAIAPLFVDDPEDSDEAVDEVADEVGDAVCAFEYMLVY